MKLTSLIFICPLLLELEDCCNSNVIDYDNIDAKIDDKNSNNDGKLGIILDTFLFEY